NHKIQSCAYQTAHYTPPEHTVYLILADTFAFRISANKPQADNDTHDIHQTIPAQGQRTNVKNHRININMNIRIDTQPAPVYQKGQRRRNASHDFLLHYSKYHAIQPSE